MKALLGAFNQDKALVGAFSVIVKTPGTFVPNCSIYLEVVGGVGHEAADGGGPVVEADALLVVAGVGLVREPEDLEALEAGSVELLHRPVQPHARVTHTCRW